MLTSSNTLVVFWHSLTEEVLIVFQKNPGHIYYLYKVVLIIGIEYIKGKNNDFMTQKLLEAFIIKFEKIIIIDGTPRKHFGH